MADKVVIPLDCKGRNAARVEVLTVPVRVGVNIAAQPDGKSINISIVGCPHCRGGWCNASGPPTSENVRCPFSLTLPGTMDLKR